MNFILGALTLVAIGLLAYKFKFVPFGMTALTEDADTPSRDGKCFSYPVYQASKIYAGALVMLNATGYAVKGATATGQIAVGRAKYQVDNTSGSSGDLYVEVERGLHRWNNSAAADEITKAEIGDTCYIVDDNTVAKTSGTNTRSIAGVIKDVDSDGVWVEDGPAITLGGLAAANNLSDVNSAATSRANIGANKVVLTVRATSLVGTTLYGVVSPVAGTITKIYSVLKGAALTTGDATLTGKIGGTAITDGAITITQAASAIGDKDNVTPSALNAVVAGDEIQFLVGGTNDAAAAFAEISLVIET